MCSSQLVPQVVRIVPALRSSHNVGCDYRLWIGLDRFAVAVQPGPVALFSLVKVAGFFPASFVGAVWHSAGSHEVDGTANKLDGRNSEFDVAIRCDLPPHGAKGFYVAGIWMPQHLNPAPLAAFTETSQHFLVRGLPAAEALVDRRRVESSPPHVDPRLFTAIRHIDEKPGASWSLCIGDPVEEREKSATMALKPSSSE